MKQKSLTVPLIERAGMGNNHLNGVCVRGRSQELLLEIRELLNGFAPSGDDYRHGLWIEVPRGKPSDWESFSEMKSWDEDIRTRADYLREWKTYYPRESQWYHLAVTRYKGNTYLHIVENDHWWCLIHDDERKEDHVDGMEWFLEPLAAFLKGKIPEIAMDVDAYNRYVEEHLPKRQRTGSIPRKDLDRIVPWQRRRPRNYKKVIRMLKETLANEEIYRALGEGKTVEEFPAFYREPLDNMSIRLYARYFRIAYEAYEDHFRHLYRRDRKEARRIKGKMDKASALSDIEFYRFFQLGSHGEITDETDFDSVEAFNEMAFDHYGELGLSRMDVHAADHIIPGKWLITIGVSYSAWVDACCEIALALYESGCPLVVYSARKILDILEGRDNVKLTPHTFHDYLNHHEEGSVFSLPYECYLGMEDELTREQYDEIVSLASWAPEEQLVLDSTIPLDDTVYDLIREEVHEPMTACEVLWELEKKYNVIVGIIDHDDWHECYLCEHGGDELRISIKDWKFATCNEAMIAVMRRFVKEKKKSSPVKGADQ